MLPISVFQEQCCVFILKDESKNCENHRAKSRIVYCYSDRLYQNLFCIYLRAEIVTTLSMIFNHQSVQLQDQSTKLSQVEVKGAFSNQKYLHFIL
jgi:hypothetical protein